MLRQILAFCAATLSLGGAASAASVTVSDLDVYIASHVDTATTPATVLTDFVSTSTSVGSASFTYDDVTTEVTIFSLSFTAGGITETFSTNTNLNFTNFFGFATLNFISNALTGLEFFIDTATGIGAELNVTDITAPGPTTGFASILFDASGPSGLNIELRQDSTLARVPSPPVAPVPPPVAPVPLPGALPLLFGAIGGLALLRRRTRPV